MLIKEKKNRQTDAKIKCWMYLRIVFDIEEAERKDVVFGPDHEPSLLLIQEEGVVRRAVGQAFKRHQVVGL